MNSSEIFISENEAIQMLTCPPPAWWLRWIETAQSTRPQALAEALCPDPDLPLACPRDGGSLWWHRASWPVLAGRVLWDLGGWRLSLCELGLVFPRASELEVELGILGAGRAFPFKVT